MPCRRWIPYIVPLSIAVLTLLFAIQKHGTGMVGRLFAPVMLLWFLVLAILGVNGIMKNPEVLQALNPAYAVNFFLQYKSVSFFALGAVVLPSLVLNYFGQGALLLSDPKSITPPFFCWSQTGR